MMTLKIGDRWSVCLFMIMFLLNGRLVQASEPPTIEQVIQGFERIEQLFFDENGVIIKYERTNSVDVVKTDYSGKLFLAEWTLAFKGNKWFATRRFTEPFKKVDFFIPSEPKTEVVKGGLILDWPPEYQRAALDKFNLGFNFYAGWFYTLNLSLDTPKHIASSNGAGDRTKEIRERYSDEADHPFLPDFLRDNRSKYQVLPKPEEVDGATCWVIEWPGMDRICVDSNRGFAMVRRLYHWGPDKPPRFEMRNSEHKEVKPGLWLPFKQTVIRYASIVAEKLPLWGKPASSTDYRVHKIEFGNVPDSIFDVELPAGTTVFDIPRNFTYKVPGSSTIDPFSSPIVDGMTEIQNYPQQSGSSRALLVISINVCVIITILSMIAYRVFTKKRASKIQ